MNRAMRGGYHGGRLSHGAPQRPTSKGANVNVPTEQICKCVCHNGQSCEDVVRSSGAGEDK